MIFSMMFWGLLLLLLEAAAILRALRDESWCDEGQFVLHGRKKTKCRSPTSAEQACPLPLHTSPMFQWHRLQSATAAAAKACSRRSLQTAAAPASGKLVIFDTTLRDGEQSPGCTLQMREKVAIAHQLCRLGVDVCEAGFPIASPGDFEAVSIIAKEVGHITEGRSQPMTIAGLARATEKDIDRCYEAVRHAPKHRVHTFLATSDIHVSGGGWLARGA